MVQFYFDIREDGTFVPDLDGAAFPTLDAVVAEAAAAATAIAHERLPDFNMQKVVVEVRDEHGARVLTATVSLLIEPVKAYVMPGGIKPSSSAGRQR
jgi:hypothetical protein